MTRPKDELKKTMDEFLLEWRHLDVLKTGDVFVIGCSTSEVLGDRIGTTGSMDVATVIYDCLQAFREQTGVHLAFQCCEHLNRALVIEEETQNMLGLSAVHVIPHQKAGGALATYGYQNLSRPVVVETIRASAGIDIGETMIGMHLKEVAVPLRFKTCFLGKARLAGAYSRKKLIGGHRAIYQ